MPNVELVQAIFILQYVQVLSGLNHYFFSYRVYRHTARHTDGYEYSIVEYSIILNKPGGCERLEYYQGSEKFTDSPKN